MTRFIESEDRRQGVLLPEYLDDYVAEAVTFFVCAVAWAIYLSRNQIPAYIEESGPSVLAVNILALLCGLTVCLVVRIRGWQRVAVVLQTGIRNAALAIFTAVAAFHRPDMAFPAAAYELIQFATAGLLVIAWRVPKPTFEAATSMDQR